MFGVCESCNPDIGLFCLLFGLSVGVSCVYLMKSQIANLLPNYGRPPTIFLLIDYDMWDKSCPVRPIETG